MSRNKEQILTIVREHEERVPFRDRCIRQNICPVCGELIMDTGSEHPFLSKYKCTKCDNIEIL